MSKGSNKENFIDDLQNPDNCITQIDFAQAYQCELQKETMQTLWSRGSVNVFTCAVYHKEETSQCFTLLTTKAETNLQLEYFCMIYIQRN